MMQLLPTAQQERWIAAAVRCKVARNHPWITQRSGGWRSPSLIARCALFVLGAVAGALTAALFAVFSFEAGLPLAGVILLAAAEWLIRARRLFHAGIEEALWTAGLLAFVARLAHAEPDWVIAAALALALAAAALRLLNPLLLTLAFAAASVAVDLDRGHRAAGEADIAVAAGIFCYGTGALALLLTQIRFFRPSYDRMLSWLMIFMPVCGFLWLVSRSTMPVRAGLGVSAGLVALAALIAGIRRRSHAALLACMASAGCLAYQLRDLTALPVKFKLIIGGSAALLLAMMLERYLRTPRRGITSHGAGQGSGALDLVQLSGAAALSTGPAPADPAFKGGGGTFSGGGADGSY